MVRNGEVAGLVTQLILGGKSSVVVGTKQHVKLTQCSPSVANLAAWRHRKNGLSRAEDGRTRRKDHGWDPPPPPPPLLSSLFTLFFNQEAIVLRLHPQYTVRTGHTSTDGTAQTYFRG